MGDGEEAGVRNCQVPPGDAEETMHTRGGRKGGWCWKVGLKTFTPLLIPEGNVGGLSRSRHHLPGHREPSGLKLMLQLNAVMDSSEVRMMKAKGWGLIRGGPGWVRLHQKIKLKD